MSPTRDRRRSLIGASLVIALAVALTAPAVAGPVGHVAWTYDQRAWVSSAGVAAVNGDATPDLILGAGDRTAFVFRCLPTGNPSSSINHLTDTASPGLAGLTALDGRDGSPLWNVNWATEYVQGLSMPAPARERFTFLYQSEVGDADGDGVKDVLVSRATHKRTADRVYLNPDTIGGTNTLSLHSASTGATLWQRSTPVPDGSFDLVTFDVFSAGDRRLGLLTTVRIGYKPAYHADSTTELVSLEPGSPPSSISTISNEPDTITSAVVAERDGAAIAVLSHIRMKELDHNHAVDFAAVRISDQGNGPATTELWRQRGAGGRPVLGDFPAYIAGDRVITVQGNNALPGKLNGVAAYSLLTGEPLWRTPVYSGQGLGPSMLQDVDGDGVEELVAAAAYGPQSELSSMGPPAPRVFVLDAVTGAVRWSGSDVAGKFSPQGLLSADVDGDGRPEVLMASMLRDGTGCGGPQDDQGVISVFDGETGAIECRWPSERVAWALTAANVDGLPGDEVMAATAGGRTYAFTNVQPGCGVLSTP